MTPEPYNPQSGPPPIPETPPERKPWYRRTWVHVVLFIFFPYVQVPLMWFQKVFSMPVRIILTVLGLFLTIGYFSSSDSSRSTQSSSSSGSSQAPDHDTSVTGASGMTVNASENSAKRLKGFSVEEAKEYGRLSAHALSKLARRNSLNALDSLNELKRLRGEREMTAADIERMDFAAPMVPESRSMIAQEAAKTGVPVEVRNAFFDGWEVGVSEVRRGGNP